MYQFNYNGDLKKYLLEEQIGTELLIKNSLQTEDILTFFSNGDKMVVNLTTKVMTWEPVCPGDPTTSRLSLRIHQWFIKGIIREVK